MTVSFPVDDCASRNLQLAREYGSANDKDVTRSESIIAMIATTFLSAKPAAHPRADATGGAVNWGGTVSRFEWVIAGIAAAVLLVLRWFYAHSLPWNSDEPQHLHVVWAWATGLLLYRDVFDNHTPLFHLLSAPLFRLLGERPDIVLPMRLAMIPLFVGSLWCTYRIGANVFSPRAGLWSALLLGFYPRFFFMMGQYRTDVLWTVLWLGSLLVLTGGQLTKKRLFFAGLLVGAAFATSMKTTLLLIVLLASGVMTWITWQCFVPRSTDSRRNHVEIWSSVAAALGGLLLIPLLLVGFFAIKGALGPLYYCVVTHNTLPGQHTPARVLRRLASWGWLTLLPALALAAATRPLFATAPHHAARKVFLILCTGLFYPVLHGFWRMITDQDYVPWLPLLALMFTGYGLMVERSAVRWGPRLSISLFLLLCAGESVWLLNHASPFGTGSTRLIATIAETLRLTERGEYVMDPKGELIFRPRPYYYALESLTRRRLEAGLMKDDLPERLIETRTAVVKASVVRMTKRSLDFIQTNYVSVGNFAVLGKELPAAPDGVVSFEVTIPERYSILTKQGSAAGTLDGQPLDGVRWLTAGTHTLSLTTPATGVTLIWARAVEKGFSPFHIAPPERPHGS